MLNNIHLDLTPRTGAFSDYGANAFRIVRVDTEAQEELWYLLVSTWHFLGAQKIVGPRVKYLLYLKRQPIGAMSYTWGSLRLRPLDDFLGWSPEQRKEYLPHCLTQHRFLLLPWIQIPHLASHIVNKSLKHLREDWKEKYGAEPYVCSTYVDESRNKGTCYIAAGWKMIGKTEGYGWEGTSMKYHGNRKYVFTTVMNKGFPKLIRKQNAQRISTIQRAAEKEAIVKSDKRRFL